MADALHRFNSLKILRHYDRLEAITRGEEPYPLDWHIYPSNVCNHKCTWCMFRQNGEQFDFRVILPREVLLRAVRDAARTGAKLIHFSGGGEPLINKATPEAMALAQELGVKVALSTNGRLLTPDIAKLVDYIRVSLNAGTPEQHHATNHGGDAGDVGDWHIILENIAKAAPYARQDLGLGFVVDYENYGDIEPFCAVAAALFGGQDTEAHQRFVHIRPGFYYDAEKDAKTRAVMPDAFAACERAKAARPFASSPLPRSLTAIGRPAPTPNAAPSGQGRPYAQPETLRSARIEPIWCGVRRLPIRPGQRSRSAGIRMSGARLWRASPQARNSTLARAASGTIGMS
jgi:pyruvate-formate lyase-activating enzyme